MNIHGGFLKSEVITPQSSSIFGIFPDKHPPAIGDPPFQETSMFFQGFSVLNQPINQLLGYLQDSGHPHMNMPPWDEDPVMSLSLRCFGARIRDAYEILSDPGKMLLYDTGP